MVENAWMACPQHTRGYAMRGHGRVCATGASCVENATTAQWRGQDEAACALHEPVLRVLGLGTEAS